jgi:hypothetical protein
MRLVLLLLLVPRLCICGNRVLPYEPSVIELSGKLELQTFPGPPNFESIRDGDDVERHFYLRLDEPVDVLPQGPNPPPGSDEVEKNVRIMQLAIGAEDDGLWARFRKVGAGGHVRIKGTLFHRMTGHHHSRVLLGVNGMEPVDRTARATESAVVE